MVDQGTAWAQTPWAPNRTAPMLKNLIAPLCFTPSVRHLAQRNTPLEHLVNMVGFVVDHVLHLEMYVVMREFGMLPFAVPLRRREILQTLGKAFTAFEEV